MQQSLTLWREVANDMFRLWCLAEEDLLRAEVPYELRDTGQGLQRVQAAVQTLTLTLALTLTRTLTLTLTRIPHPHPHPRPHPHPHPN